MQSEPPESDHEVVPEITPEEQGELSPVPEEPDEPQASDEAVVKVEKKVKVPVKRKSSTTKESKPKSVKKGKKVRLSVEGHEEVSVETLVVYMR